MNDYIQTLEQKNIVLIDDFLAETECHELLYELQFTHWSKSNVVKYIGDERSPAYFSDMRKSQTAGQIWFSDRLNEKLQNVEHRLAALLSTSRQHLEEWQATVYGKGDKFDFHVDCGNWQDTKAGERKRTILLYLDTPLKGGETRFRALNLTVPAIAGRVLIWNNLLPSGKCNFAMIHAGLPLEEGTKTILVTWERQRVLKETATPL